MNEMKYIIFSYRGDREYSIVFPKDVLHKDMSSIHTVYGNIIVRSAGVVRFDTYNRTAEAFGRSESMDFESRPEDSDILKRDFFGI